MPPSASVVFAVGKRDVGNRGELTAEPLAQIELMLEQLLHL
jgi:hypothetical protein